MAAFIDHCARWPGTIRLFEIEDRNPMEIEKVLDYAEAWFCLDSADVDLELFVYDRYGEHERQLDLQEYYRIFHHGDYGRRLREFNEAAE